jgi:hypothetical protein
MIQSNVLTVREYIRNLPADRRKELGIVRKAIKENLPKGYQEAMQYGMIGYGVPLKIYPAGYLGDKTTPLPYAALASQKKLHGCVSNEYIRRQENCGMV